MVKESLKKLADISLPNSVAYKSSSSSSLTCSNEEINRAKNILGNINAENTAIITNNVDNYAVASNDLVNRLSSYITVSSSILTIIILLLLIIIIILLEFK